MANAKNFLGDFSKKPTSGRSLTDEPVQDPEQPSPEQMIDALYFVLMERLDRIEELIKGTHGER